MQEGTRIHQKLQRRMGKNYRPEVTLSGEIPVSRDGIEFSITLEGRADGIFSDETGEVVDEIKGVYRDIRNMQEAVPVHRAQALCYAYIYASQNHLEAMGIRMTYCHIPTENVRYFAEHLSFQEISDQFNEILQEYVKWAAWQIKWQEARNASLKELEFPFPYRESKSKLVKGYTRAFSAKNAFTSKRLPELAKRYPQCSRQ